MKDDTPALQWTFEWWRPVLVSVSVICAATAVVLFSMGRVAWCKCGTWVPWSWDVWSLHNSQHIVDPYAFSHVLHGVVFYGALYAVFRGRRPRLAIALSALIEAAWEVLENTEQVIQHYRESTVSLDYYGDSVANSMADIGWCVLGAVAAAAVPWWVSVLGFALTELMLVVWIKDSLLLNVLMLLYPLEAVKRWQLGE